MSRPETNVGWAQALIGGLLQGGVRHAVISPGSRNTALVLALDMAAREGHIALHDVLDERSAAFFALGLARMSAEPVILSCTSGSAGAHYLPAMIEASHARLPLIALTADRPAELQGVGAAQTTIQRSFYAAHVRLFIDPGQIPQSDACPKALAKKAIAAALGFDPGPVHMNLPFKKPLWDAEAAPLGALERAARPPAHPIDEAAVARAVDALSSATRGLLVCGPGDLGRVSAFGTRDRGRLVEAIGRLADQLGWPLLVDGASQVRGAPELPGAVTVGDTIARSETLRKRLVPDFIVRIGQSPTSTALRQMLALQGSGRTLLLDVSGRVQDPDGLGAEVLAGDTVEVLSALSEGVKRAGVERDTAWRDAWLAAARAIDATQRAESDPRGLWSGACARLLAESAPEGATLHLASSLAVRAFDAFGGPTRPGVQVTSNRGVNGIDGTLATAFGQARASSGPSAVLLGDLAFLHDLGTLASLGGTWDGPPLVLVVLDNQGGGIFDHLPIADHPSAYEAHFVTPPRVMIDAIAKPLVDTFVSVTSEDTLRGALKGAFVRPAVSVIHVPFNRDMDLKSHQRAWLRGACAAEELVA